MKLEEFIILEPTTQRTVAFEIGAHLGDRFEPGSLVSLYQVDSFYVEAFYQPRTRRLLSLVRLPIPTGSCPISITLIFVGLSKYNRMAFLNGHALLRPQWLHVTCLNGHTRRYLLQPCRNLLPEFHHPHHYFSSTLDQFGEIDTCLVTVPNAKRAICRYIAPVFHHAAHVISNPQNNRPVIRAG
jgi:hypothetical protein